MFPEKFFGYYDINTHLTWNEYPLNPLGANPQNGQTHSNNLSAFADELFECVWPFCEVGA